MLVLTGAIERSFVGMVYVSEDTLTLAWDAIDSATRYEIQAVDVLHEPQTIKDLGQSTGTQLVLNRLGASLWAYQVRACNAAGCSPWAKSDDPAYATVDGQPGAWRVYWKTPKPTGGGVS